MGLMEQQRALARLCTDGGLREQFLGSQQSIARSLVSQEVDARWLSQLSPQQLAVFARSLQRKRLRAVGKLLPRTRIALGKQFASHLFGYAARPVPSGLQDHRWDACGFVAYLRRSASDAGIAPSIIDLARYEGAWLEATNPGRSCLARTFRYRVDRASQGRPDVGAAPDLDRHWLLALWIRPSRRGSLYHLIVPVPSLATWAARRRHAES